MDNHNGAQLPPPPCTTSLSSLTRGDAVVGNNVDVVPMPPAGAERMRAFEEFVRPQRTKEELLSEYAAAAELYPCARSLPHTERFNHLCKELRTLVRNQQVMASKGADAQFGRLCAFADEVLLQISVVAALGDQSLGDQSFATYLAYNENIMRQALGEDLYKKLCHVRRFKALPPPPGSSSSSL